MAEIANATGHPAAAASYDARYRRNAAAYHAHFFYNGQEDAPPSAGPADPFCGTAPEASTLTLECADAGATIESVLLASFGSGVVGTCPSLQKGPCHAPASLSVTGCTGIRVSGSHLPSNRQT